MCTILSDMLLLEYIDDITKIVQSKYIFNQLKRETPN